MKLSKKLCWIVIGLLCVGGILFFSGKLFWQNSDKTMTSTQNTAYLLQEANDLYGQWAKTQDDHLIRQVTDKYTLWLQNNWNSSDKKLIAKTLRSRVNAFTVLNEPNKAIHDFEKSIEYDPNGALQLIVCDLREKQGDLSDAQGCYSKAVTIFEKTKTPQKDVKFLLVRI